MMGTSRAETERGVGLVWPVAFGVFGGFTTAAAHAAISTNGAARTASIVALAVCFPTTMVFGWLFYAWNARKWLYKPPPPRTGVAVSAADRKIL